MIVFVSERVEKFDCFVCLYCLRILEKIVRKRLFDFLSSRKGKLFLLNNVSRKLRRLDL